MLELQGSTIVVFLAHFQKQVSYFLLQDFHTVLSEGKSFLESGSHLVMIENLFFFLIALLLHFLQLSFSRSYLLSKSRIVSFDFLRLREELSLSL